MARLAGDYEATVQALCEQYLRPCMVEGDPATGVYTFVFDPPLEPAEEATFAELELMATFGVTMTLVEWQSIDADPAFLDAYLAMNKLSRSERAAIIRCLVEGNSIRSTSRITGAARNVERQNLTMRMGMRRFTRLTNAFSKKVQNHAAMVALHFLYYNFGRVHSSLGKLTTRAMAAGVSDHVWTCDEIAGLVD